MFSDRVNDTRRGFLKATGGVVLGFYLPFANDDAIAKVERKESIVNVKPNSFIKITPDNAVVVIVHKSEMGQGVYTSLPMLVAEELEADWDSITIEAAPAHKDYYHTKWGPFQGTGASSSISSCWLQLRTAGATAKEMLITAASKVWNVSPESCYAEKSYIIHEPSKRRLSYSQLTKIAAKLPIPENVKLKNPEDFKLIGKSKKHIEVRDKITGKAIYGIDVVIPDMLIAVLVRSPVFGGKLLAFDDSAALKVEGIKHIVGIDQGVAVVADNFWAANKASELLKIKWSRGSNKFLSTTSLRKKYAKQAENRGLIARKVGSVKSGKKSSSSLLNAVYEVPYLAHAPMEPLNCVADVRNDRCDIWVGTQMQTTDQQAASEITGLPVSQIFIHTTLLGSSFGRRANPHADFVKETVNISKAISKPVKLIWTREDDIRGGYYRPMHYSKIEAHLDSKGFPVAWSHRMVTESIAQGTQFEHVLIHDGIDHLSVEGASNHPYAIKNQLVDNHTVDNGVPVLWWRSVGHSFTAFVVESFLDEIAFSSDQDPVQIRINLLTEQPRHLMVLDVLFNKSSWGEDRSPKVYQGVAIHKSFGSISGQVVEVIKKPNGDLKIKRIVCVVDCGLVVNPDTVIAQMESGIVYGLSAALYGEITFEEGEVQQHDFQTYQILRMKSMPKIEVHIIKNSEQPTGIGEVGTPPVAAALCNAIHAATGQRIRSLPIKNFTDVSLV